VPALASGARTDRYVSKILCQVPRPPLGAAEMPKIVDRNLRREEVVEATWRLMARVGIDRVSIRDVAAEAGCSTGVIGHYFRDKDDVLRSALRLVWSRERSRIAFRTQGRHGLAALEATAAAVLPMGDEQSLEMAVWVSFWSRAFGDPVLAAEQLRYYDEWLELLRRHFHEARDDGELAAECDPVDAARHLAALVDGLGIQAIFETRRADPARRDPDVLGLVRSHLQALRPDPHRPDPPRHDPTK
jgi:AcrR family transcriptional regulator